MESTQEDIKLNVNGETHQLTVEARELLVHTLRERLDYTSVNVGCETSLCGACTVLCDGKALKSCTRFTVQADGAEIETIDGLADEEELHPIQEAFHEEHALQCGYCTPGIVMTTKAYLDDNPDPTRDEIKEDALQGNICRCTGYQNIVNAIEKVATEAQE